jgi:anti-sigma regulatory factor (Ser/Thr protein kinase)
LKHHVIIPDLTAGNAIDFCNNDLDFADVDKVVFDYGKMSTFEPFGMLLVSSKIRELKRIYSDITYYTKAHKHHGYAAHMGYFQSAGQPFGKKPGEAEGNDRYIPITALKVKELRLESYQQTEEIQDTIVRKANDLAQVLGQGNDTLVEVLSYSIRELMRNIVEHADSEVILFAAQSWPSKDVVELAILDEGVGVHQALSVNPNLDIDDYEDALMLSIEPGISGKAFKYKGKMRKQRGSIWDNSGYGLYVTSEISQIGGNFIICSGGSAMIVKNNQHQFKETKFQGTAIRMRLEISSINKFGSTLINKIVDKGEKKAKSNSLVSMVRASKVSRLL